MTTLLEISTRALRELEVLEGSATATAEDSSPAQEVALDVVERLAQSGEGRSYVDVDVDSDADAKIEQRIIVLAAGVTIKTPVCPPDFARFSIVPLAGDVVLAYNARKLEGSLSNITVSSPAVWMYRADLADWQKITGLVVGSELPYPAWAEPFLAMIIAGELAPRFGVDLDPEKQRRFAYARAMIESRFLIARNLDLSNIAGSSQHQAKSTVFP